MTAERKAIKRNLMDLIDYGYEIEYTESTRRIPNSKTGRIEENSVYSDFYLIREFTDGELRLLIDSVLFSKHISRSQRRELVNKLGKLSSCHFRSQVKHIATMPNDTTLNQQLFLTIETLDKAITQSKQVSFYYNEYGLDKKLHPRRDSTGVSRRYRINPYQMAAANGRYYLICNYDKYDDVGNFRLDRISDIQILHTPCKPMEQVKGLENGLNLPRHMAEHIYMFAGESASVAFRLQKSIVSDVIDWFGNEVTFSDETDKEVTARVEVNLEAMRRWALQYALYVRVLSPKRLVEKLREDIKTVVKQYEV